MGEFTTSHFYFSRHVLLGGSLVIILYLEYTCSLPPSHLIISKRAETRQKARLSRMESTSGGGGELRLGFSTIETGAECLSPSEMFHIVKELIGFVLYMHHQIPSYETLTLSHSPNPSVFLLPLAEFGKLAC